MQDQPQDRSSTNTPTIFVLGDYSLHWLSVAWRQVERQGQSLAEWQKRPQLQMTVMCCSAWLIEN
ncbi:MAG: hypothetical protein ABJP82_19565, partial [Hyphomicrobiales bacterium]